MNYEDRPVGAFVVSLIAGLWMLAMGGMMGWGYMGSRGWSGNMYAGGPGAGGAYNWMWAHHQWMHGYGGGVLWFWLGTAAAILVLVGAFAMYARPATAPRWGVVVLISSCVALLGGAGGLFAGILGMVGGALAMAWKPQG